MILGGQARRHYTTAAATLTARADQIADTSPHAALALAGLAEGFADLAAGAVVEGERDGVA